MTHRKIKELKDLVLKLPKRPSSLRFANAYIDQALMNFSYETMSKNRQGDCLAMIRDMIEHFDSIRGR